MTPSINYDNWKSADPTPNQRGNSRAISLSRLELYLRFDSWRMRQTGSPRADKYTPGGVSLLLVCKSGLTGKPYAVQVPPP